MVRFSWSNRRSSSTNSISKYLGAEEKGPASSVPSAKSVYVNYGQHVFTGKLAEKYLKANGGSPSMMDDPSWVKDKVLADIVAAAVLHWYVYPTRAVCKYLNVVLTTCKTFNRQGD